MMHGDAWCMEVRVWHVPRWDMRGTFSGSENVRAAQVGGSHGYKADAGKVGVRPHLYLRCGRRGTWYKAGERWFELTTRANPVAR